MVFSVVVGGERREGRGGRGKEACWSVGRGGEDVGSEGRGGCCVL